MTPPLFVIQIGAFSFETSILSVSLRAQWPVVCLGDLKTRPILLAVPEAAGQHKKIDRVIGGKQKRGTMSTSVTSASDLRWYQAIDRKLWIILAITYLGWMLDSMDLNLFTVVLVPSLRELLGPQASPQMIGYYGGAIAAMQLLGWGVGGLILVSSATIEDARVRCVSQSWSMRSSPRCPASQRRGGSLLFSDF
jgi:hypothetical protein